MNVVVLAKYVPNPSGNPPEIGPDFRLRREEAAGALDPSDEAGVETAVCLVSEHGGEVTAVSVGPDRAERALRRALAIGAHRAVLVVDPGLEGADVLATAKTLAAAIERRPFELVIAGVESTDGATGTLPMTLAELLGVACATFARRVVVDDEHVEVERQTETGYETMACTLPAVVTLTAGAAAARYTSLKDDMEARKKPIERLSLADLGLRADDVRPLQRVTSVAIAPAREPGELVENELGATTRIVQLLEEAGVI